MTLCDGANIVQMTSSNGTNIVKMTFCDVANIVNIVFLQDAGVRAPAFAWLLCATVADFTNDQEPADLQLASRV